MPGSAASSVFGLRKASAVLRGHGLRAGVQIARARVVAEPGPQPQHVVERRGRERVHIRPARDEAEKIGRDRLHGGLLQHDLGQPDAIRIGGLAAQRAPRQLAAVAVVPGEQRGRLRLRAAAAASAIVGRLLASWLDRWQSPPHMNKPGRSRARPLADILGKTLGDVFAKQGFASTELVTRWTEIVGPEIAAHSQPEKIQWPRPFEGKPAEPGTLGAAGRGPGGDRNPAPVRGDPRAGQPVLRLAGGRTGCGCGRRRCAAAGPSPCPSPIRRRRPGSPRHCRKSRTRSCVTRWRGSARRSNRRDVRAGPAGTGVRLPQFPSHASGQDQRPRNGTVSYGQAPGSDLYDRFGRHFPPESADRHGRGRDRSHWRLFQVGPRHPRLRAARPGANPARSGRCGDGRPDGAGPARRAWCWATPTPRSRSSNMPR